MKIVTIVGARPQFVKAAVVSRALADRGGMQEIIVHTGQHYDANMSAVFFDELSIPEPQYHLGIGGGLHGAMTGRQLEAIEQVLVDEKPDWLLVYGDTNSTLAGALAAAKLHIPVAHVEAGLRSFNRRMPEEINRILTDHVAALLLTPSATADRNLANEGVNADQIVNVGDTMYDATLFYRDRARRPAGLPMDVENGFVLATIHRAENTDDPIRLRGILDGLSDSGRDVVLPLHPRTRARLADLGIALPARVREIDPVGYLEMLWLEDRCAAVVTDSGGVQKEAYFHGKRCVTVRDETEWVELVELGVNAIVGVDRARIAAAVDTAMRPIDGDRTAYGKGDAGDRIAAALAAAV